MRFRLIGIVLAIIMTAAALGGIAPVEATAGTIVPVRIAVLLDGSNPNVDLASALYNNVQRVLGWNKLPFDVLDIATGQHPALVDQSGNPKYSAVVIAADGTAIDVANSQAILAAVTLGTGAVAVLPSAANTLLQPAFGIAALGSIQSSAGSFSVLQDEFTLSYSGAEVKQPSYYLNHSLLAGTGVVARFVPDNAPAIWTFSHGAGRTIYHNTTAANTMSYWGLLLQSILYVMPMGVSSPSNAMAIEVDDCPMTYYTTDYVQQYYYNFMTNYLAWLEAYQVHSTFFVSFSYSGNISDFWANPEPLQGVAAIVRSGNELGLHNGSLHSPLDAAFWGSPAAVDAEVHTTNQALTFLGEQLSQQYGLQLADVTAYVAPADIITDYGYQALDSDATIKYVGQSFAPNPPAAVPAEKTVASAQAQTLPSLPRHLPDVSIDYLRSASSLGSGQIPSAMEPSVNALPGETFRDFGWEADLSLYNLPRIQGGFAAFDRPQDPGSSTVYSILRSSLESGQPYIAFTHPPEADLYDDPSITMATTFEAYSKWADFIAANYPHYRWMTASQIGDYLSSRAGTLAGRWSPASRTLQLTLARPDDVVHIKSQEYLKSVAVSGTAMTLTFVSTPTTFESDAVDIVKMGNDYFIYPLGQKALMPKMPAQPFVFKPLTPDQRSLSVSVTGQGSVTKNPPQGAYDAGASVQLTAVPAAGWAFTAWSGSSNLASTTANPTTITMSGNETVTAIFFTPTQYSLTANVTGQGSVTRNPAQVTYNAGASVQLTAVPAAGWAFSAWSGSSNLTSTTANPTTITMNGNETVTAIFTVSLSTEITRPVATGPDDGFSGSWGHYNGLFWYEAGNPGSSYNGWYRFTGISIPRGANILHAYLQTVQVSWGNGTNLKISAEKTAAPTAPASTADLSGRARTIAGVTWSTGSSDSAYHNSPDLAPVIQELVNNYDYSAGGAIQLLVDNNGSTNAGEHIGRTFESGSPPRLDIVYQLGSPPTQYSLTANVTGQGSVTRNPAQVTYNAGASVQLTAVPAAGWAFSAWSGSSNLTSTTANPTTITMNGNETVTAIFTASLSTEITRPVATGPDDGFSGSWGHYNGLFWYEAGNPGSSYNGWYRFTGISIPRGANILHAYLQTVQVSWGNGTNLKISAEKTAAPTAPASTADLSGRARTIAGVTWSTGSSDSAYHNSPDLAPVIQELVNNYDYSAGGAIQLLVDNNGSTNAGEHIGRTFESGSPPRLDIVYQLGSPPTQYSLTANVTGQGSVTRNPAQVTYNAGASVQLTAVPAAGWAFSAWSGSSNLTSTTANPTTITMNGNETVTAIFTASLSTEITRPVATGPDDGFSGSWGHYNGLFWYEAGNPGSSYNGWYRFTGISIPRGANILHAYLQTVQVSWGNGTNLKISAEKTAAPTAPASTADLSGRARTIAGVTWSTGSSDSAYHNSPDLAPVIQELVNNYDYSAGGAIQLLVDNNGSTNAGEHIGRTFESGSPPRLDIVYQ